jgi:hypothetical protein
MNLGRSSDITVYNHASICVPIRTGFCYIKLYMLADTAVNVSNSLARYLR